MTTVTANHYPLAQRVIWVTGASTGIGRDVAKMLAAQGNLVIASARSADKLQSLAAEQRNIIALPLDMTDTASVHAAIDKIESQHGPIHTVLLNAGGWEKQNAGTLTLANVQNTFNLNVLANVAALEKLVPLLVARGQGHIVITASVAGYRGLPNALGYCASKAAAISMAETLRLDLAPLGIKVQVVNPGFVRTPLTDKNDFPMPFIMEPVDAAAALVRGMQGTGFEITFPKKFTYLMKLLRLLPYALYFPLVGAGTKGKVKYK